MDRNVSVVELNIINCDGGAGTAWERGLLLTLREKRGKRQGYDKSQGLLSYNSNRKNENSIVFATL